MDANDRHKRETEALIEAIWGPQPEDVPAQVDPATRERQNQALAAAMKAYLQRYLAEM